MQTIPRTIYKSAFFKSNKYNQIGWEELGNYTTGKLLLNPLDFTHIPALTFPLLINHNVVLATALFPIKLQVLYSSRVYYKSVDTAVLVNHKINCGLF